MIAVSLYLSEQAHTVYAILTANFLHHFTPMFYKIGRPNLLELFLFLQCFKRRSWAQNLFSQTQFMFHFLVGFVHMNKKSVKHKPTYS